MVEKSKRDFKSKSFKMVKMVMVMVMFHLVSIHIIMLEKSKRDFIKIVKMVMVIKELLEEEECFT